jgi:tetratricopeptide (TPR) repeat protein
MKRVSITVIFFSILFSPVLAQQDTTQLDTKHSPTQIKALFQSAARTRNHWRLGAAFFARAQYAESVHQDYQSAILDYTKSAKIFLSLRDSLSYYTIITRLSGVYIVAEPSLIDQSRKELSRAILYFRRHNHLKRLGYALINLGSAYQKQHRWKEAYPDYQEAARIGAKIRDNYMGAITDHFFGNYYEVHHQYNKAIQYLQKSYAWGRENNIGWLQARNLLYIGTNFYALRKYSQADHYLQSALNVIIHKHPVLELKKETLVMLAKNCRAARQYQQASLYASQALVASDSLAASEKARDLRLFQRNLELEQRKYELSNR